MMRKQITAIIVLLALTVGAAAENVPYRVRYVKEHLLCQQGDEVNVLDVDMEWPEVIDGADMRPLQVFAIKHLLGLTESDFDSAYSQFKQAFGEPVREQFASAPDDEKMCYVDIKFRLVAHEPGRYVSYAVEGSTTPGRLSSHVDSHVAMLITYDLIGLSVLRRDDILMPKKMSNQFHDIELLLPEQVDDGMFSNLSVNDACLTRGKVMLYNSAVTIDGRDLTYVRQVSPDDLSRFLSKEAKALLKPSKATATLVDCQERMQLDGEPIYTKPDENPQFQVPGRTLDGYLGDGIGKVNSEIDGECFGMVHVQLTIDKNGNTRDVHIVQPLAPAYDREAVRVAKSLPRWKPALKDGRPVAAKVMLVMNFNGSGSKGKE